MRLLVHMVCLCLTLEGNLLSLLGEEGVLSLMLRFFGEVAAPVIIVVIVVDMYGDEGCLMRRIFLGVAGRVIFRI